MHLLMLLEAHGESTLLPLRSLQYLVEFQGLQEGMLALLAVSENFGLHYLEPVQRSQSGGFYDFATTNCTGVKTLQVNDVPAYPQVFGEDLGRFTCEPYQQKDHDCGAPVSSVSARDQNAFALHEEFQDLLEPGQERLQRHGAIDEAGPIECPQVCDQWIPSRR